MKGRIVTAVIAGAFAAAVFAAPAIAGKGGNGNGAPEGAHYTLNIIGVSKAKNPKMDNSNRHTIFVPLVSEGKGKWSKAQYCTQAVIDMGSVELCDEQSELGDPIPGTEIVDSQIWLTPGEDFRVCDGNGFDAATGCPLDANWDGNWNTVVYNANGEPVQEFSAKQGAVFMLPCNTGIDATVDCDNIDSKYKANYTVWARALGTPGGSARITTCATVDVDGTYPNAEYTLADGELYCSLENVLLVRTTGKSNFTDVTNELTSLLITYCTEWLEEVCVATATERYELFATETYDWFWNYDNDNLRVAQIRFYDNN